MRTLTLLRLILKLLREIKALRHDQLGQLQAINASLNHLVLIKAREARFFPQTLSTDPTRKPVTLADHYSDAVTYAAAESVRSRMVQELGREPFEEEFARELDLELQTRSRQQVVG